MRIRSTASVFAAVALSITTATAVPTLAQAADSSATYRFDIGGESLAQALRDYGQVAGQAIIFTEDLVAGLKVQPLRGDYTAEAALEKLLEGTGLTARRSPSGAFMIERVRASSNAGSLDSAHVDRVEEIVVTATRRAQSVQDVPFNIQALNGEMLEKVGALSQSDFIRLVPGLSASGEGVLTNRLVLRGLRTASSDATAVTTTTYVDDTPVDLPARGSPLDLRLLDIDRIEVLRGPQGTLYGGGAIGGSIRYISKKPDVQGFEGKLGAGLSSTDGGDLNYDAHGMVNVPLGERVAVRGSLGYFSNDGFIDNVRLGVDDINDSRTLSGRVAVRALPTDGLDVVFTHYYQKEDYGDRSMIASDLGKYEDDRPSLGYRDFLAQISNLTATYDFGPASLTSSTSYTRDEAEGALDVTVYVRDLNYGSWLDPALVPQITQSRDEDELDASVLTQELRLVSNDDGRFDWIVGAYYSKQDLDLALVNRVAIPFPNQAVFESDFVGAPINDDVRFLFNADRETRDWALFGEVGFKLLPNWRVSVGARHFDYQSEQVFYAIDNYSAGGRDANGFARTTPLPNEFAFGEVENDGQVYRFNTSYQLDRGLVYLTIAEGFRPGGYNIQNSFIVLEPDERQFEPDTIVSYEVGGKLALADGRVYLSSALFYVDWSDIQTSVYSSTVGFTINGNAGKASSRGFELELGARDLVVDGLDLSVTYGHTTVELEETVPFLGFEGERAPSVPRNSGSFTLDYAHPLGSDTILGFTGSTSYTGKSYSAWGPAQPDLQGNRVPIDQYLELGDYWLTDVSARVEHGSWLVRAFVRNLGNTYAKLGYAYFVNTGTSPFRSPYTERSVNSPRTIGIEFTNRF